MNAATSIAAIQNVERWTSCERPPHLAAVQDAFSRRILGWSMADHMREELVIDALQMALRRRRPDPGVIHHSDQGFQLGFNHSLGDRVEALTVNSRRSGIDGIAVNFPASRAGSGSHVQAAQVLLRTFDSVHYRRSMAIRRRLAGR